MLEQKMLEQTFGAPEENSAATFNALVVFHHSI
jgi:hypothetical protein